MIKKKTLLQIYHEAASEDYNFLWVNLMSKDQKRNVYGEMSEIYNSKLKLFHMYIYIYI